MNTRSILAALALSACAFGGVAIAEEAKLDVKDLSPWAGKYVSGEGFWADAKTDKFYQDIAQVCKDEGKDVPVETIRETMVDQMKCLFSAVTIDANAMDFTMKDDGKVVHVDYEYVGPVTDGEGYEWYAFKAKDVNDETKPMENMVMTALHSDPEHFHFRYGSDSAEQMLADKSLENWYPTMYHDDLTWEKCFDKTDPKMVAKYLFLK